jgi:hypothetical protein
VTRRPHPRDRPDLSAEGADAFPASVFTFRSRIAILQPVIRRVLLAALLAPGALPAQAPVLPPLAFFGFEAGARLTPVSAQVRALGGRGLRCDRSRRDRAVHECRATIFEPGSGRAVDLWLSAIDSAAGVLTVSSTLTGVDLDRWKTTLEQAYGVVDANVQGSQWMLQWVRQGRMLRLTWRIERGAMVTSVSLVDGRVLDGWGRARAPATPTP